MIYYMSKCDWFESYTGKQIHYAELFTETELLRMKINNKDKNLLFIKIKTPYRNTTKLFGMRKLINIRKVEEL